MAKVPVLPLFVAFWFFLSAALLWQQFRSTVQVWKRLRPIGLYLVGIGTFFVMQAVDVWTRYSCTLWDCTNLTGGIAIVLGATFIARFPMRQLWPNLEHIVAGGLAFVAVTAQVAMALRLPAQQVQFAQAYGFLLAGVFTVGFLVYESFRRGSTTGMGIGLSLAPCCVVGHGLAMLPVAATVSLPLLGVPMKAPMLSAVLAPISLIVVLRLVSSVDPTEGVNSTQPAGPSP